MWTWAGEPSPGADVARGEPSPGADATGGTDCASSWSAVPSVALACARNVLSSHLHAACHGLRAVLHAVLHGAWCMSHFAQLRGREGYGCTRRAAPPAAPHLMRLSTAERRGRAVRGWRSSRERWEWRRRAGRSGGAEGRKERRVLGTTHGSCHAPHQSKKRADRPFARAALRVRNAASGSASADRTYL